MLVLADQARNRAGQADPLERRSVEEVGEQRPELVTGALRFRRDAPALAELGSFVKAEDRLRVPYVDREQHRGANLPV